MNPDGSKALILTNYDDQYKTFSVKQGKKVFTYSVPSRSVVSFIWE
jgi:O-glycosyl hydrolase